MLVFMFVTALFTFDKKIKMDIMCGSSSRTLHCMPYLDLTPCTIVLPSALLSVNLVCYYYQWNVNFGGWGSTDTHYRVDELFFPRPHWWWLKLTPGSAQGSFIVVPQILGIKAGSAICNRHLISVIFLAS